MKKLSIATCNLINQVEVSKDGEKNMLGKAFRVTLDNIIRENCDYKDGCYHLFACDLPTHDKRILLSYLTSLEDFEFFTENFTRELETYKEFEPEMQYLINNRIDDLWHEDMREMGNFLNHDQNTGEPFYK